MTYTEIQGMRKKADGFLDVLHAASGAVTAAVVTLLAGGAALGYGAGWGAAKLFSHGERDMDTIRKGYENERLKTDIGYVGSQLRNEIEQSKAQEPPKAARVLI